MGRERVVRRTSREALIDGLTGTTVTAARRRGKYLMLPLDSGDEMMIHLRMSGQMLLAPRGAARPPHTHVVLHLDDGCEAWFVDPRTFGEIVVYDPERVDEQMPDLARLGVDPITDDAFTPAFLRTALRSTSRALKVVLLDQRVIAGIGNIYADESLHCARLRPDRPAVSVDTRGVRRLHQAILDVLHAAIAAGGSTLDDSQYVDLLGKSGWYQDQHTVYGRTGERCRTCGRGWIRRITAAGRGTHFCPVCQR